MDFCRGIGIRIQSLTSLNLEATSSCSRFASDSHMDQNTQLKREYFELYRMLNRSNLHKNQTYRIQLISKKVKYNWEPSGFSGLFNLEKQVSSFANNYSLEKINPDELTKKIKSFVFQNFK